MIQFNEGSRGELQDNLYAQVLYSIGRITARVNHHHILQPVLNTIREVVPVDAIGVYVVSDDKHSVERFSLISGHHQVIPGQGQKMAMDDSELAQLAVENDRFIYHDLTSVRGKHLLDKEIAIQAGIRCAAAVSIRQANAVCGSVVFDSYASHQYTTDHLPFFQEVAELIGIYLENHRLLQQSLQFIGQDVSPKDQIDLITKLQGDMKWQLTSIALQVDRLRHILHPVPRFRQELQMLNQQTKGLLCDLRNTISQVDNRCLTGLALSDALASKLKQFEQQTGLKTRWGMIGIPTELSPSICEGACYFLQEVLHSFHKYSQANSVKAHLLWQQNMVVLEVEDDGLGFDTERIAVDDKLGANLGPLLAKANQLGGTLTIHSAPGWGTRLTFKLPTRRSAQLGQMSMGNGLPPKNNELISVLLVGRDQDIYTTSLLDCCPDLKVVGTAVNKEDVIYLLHQVFPDVILIGEKAPKAIILELLNTLQNQSSAPPVIVLDKQTERLDDTEFTQFNVQFCCSKNLDAATLTKMLLQVVKGESIKQTAILASSEEHCQTNHIESLSGREREILDLVCKGLANQEIANQLVVQESTVRWHMHNILQKLSAKSRTHAARIALEHGWFL